MTKTQTTTRTDVDRQPRMVRQFSLVVTGGPDAALTLGLRRGETVAVGTAADNELRLTDPRVSRYHLELEAGDAAVVVKDLGSRNGTYALGGARIWHAELPAGSKLELGQTTLELREAQDASVEPADRSSGAIPGIIAESAAMKQIVESVHRLAPARVSVLVRGETGTGKELIAHALHDLGPRAGKPFVVVDCGSMPATLIAAELFGHERGAFTGADRRSAGAFERADSGTLFLDEIGELPLQVQATLLGALERRRFRRLGGDAEVPVDVRVVAATHRDLRSEVNSGGFRADLYFRLAAARLLLPPLRDRPEDIEALVRHFVAELQDSGSFPFGPEALSALRRHRWSGNARELRNVIESAIAMGTLQVESSLSVGSATSSRVGSPGQPDAPTAASTSRGAEETPGEDPGDLQTYRRARADALAGFERGYLGRLMQACGQNASEASRRAKMDRGHLLTLLKRHGLR